MSGPHDPRVTGAFSPYQGHPAKRHVALAVPRKPREQGALSQGWLTLRLRVLVCSLHFHAAAAKSLQSCLTLCDPVDGSPPGSRVPGILQTRTLEWVAISFSSA